jgi:hypothetical protein
MYVAVSFKVSRIKHYYTFFITIQTNATIIAAIAMTATAAGH